MQAVEEAIKKGLDLDGTPIPLEMLNLYNHIMEKESKRERSGVKKSMRNRCVKTGSKHFDKDTLNQLLINAGWEGLRDKEIVFSDGNLHILNSNFNTTAIVKFFDLFPISLSSLEFEATDTDINYFTADAIFKYTVYNIVKPDGRTPL